MIGNSAGSSSQKRATELQREHLELGHAVTEIRINLDGIFWFEWYDLEESA